MFNNHLKKTISIISLLIFVLGLWIPSIAQPFKKTSEYRTWSVGLHGGIMSQANIFELGREFEGLVYNVGYGAYIKKQFLPALAVQLEYLGGAVQGTNGDDQFQTIIPWSASATMQFTLGNINWRYQDALIKPYLNLGMGMMSYKPWTYFDEVETQYSATNGMFIPMIVGAKIRVTNGINVDLGYRMNFARTYALDGLTTEKRDVFSYSHVGLEFALGKKSKPYLGNTNPVSEMYQAQLMQYDEVLQTLREEKNSLENKTASLEAENNRLKGQMERLYADLADDDKDGVANRYDQCPNTPQGVKVDGAGCPLPDVKMPTPVIQQIYISEEDKKIVDEAIQNLEFDSSAATIRPTSFPSLNKVAILLIEKNFSLKLAGHTDSTGSFEMNMKLSRDRAEAVKAYLVSKGVNASRIEAVGYGSTQPIADNRTEEGKQKNRRVEFTLY